MEQLIAAYLISINHYLVVNGEGEFNRPDGEIINIKPYIEGDEQHYSVELTSMCMITSTECVTVSVSDLLTFMYNRNDESPK